jgi:hypothetical protein
MPPEFGTYLAPDNPALLVGLLGPSLTTEHPPVLRVNATGRDPPASPGRKGSRPLSSY